MSGTHPTHEGKLFIFSAPSGSGKTTLVRHLLSQPELGLAFSVSATTRKKREGEVEGENYYYMTPEAFRTHISQGDFLEWEEVYTDHLYGTLRREVERLWSEGKHVIFDIDVVGGLNIKRQFPERTLALFVRPPDVETLRARLSARSTESSETLALRLEKAEQELQRAPEFDAVIHNDDLETAKADAYRAVREFLGMTTG